MGGVSRYHIELAKEINHTEDTVDIPAFYIRNRYLADYLKKPVKQIHSAWLSMVVNRLNTAKTMLSVLLRSYDIIHLTWYNPSVFEFCKRKKTVITVHDMIQEIFGTDAITIGRKEKAIYQADGIIAISESTKKDIIKFYPDIPESKIRVIYHGTNHLCQPECPKSLALPSRYILYVGTRNSYKNAALLMKSISEKLQREKDLHLLFIGGGSFSDGESAYIKQLHIEDKVMQYNATDAELAYIYQHAECFVYPSAYEGFGFPILEAFDNKCPVICSNTSSLPEVGGEAAIYFSPDNCEELTQKIDELLSDEDLRNKHIALGAERVKKFTWERTAQETRDFYREIATQ